jgi:predicted DNA-binding transcriptional regulator AlpA
MPVQIDGKAYYTHSEVSEELAVSRQTLWRWREKGQIPPGLRYRTRQVLFNSEEVEAIRQFANRLEPIELGTGGSKQIGLFPRTMPKDQS